MGRTVPLRTMAVGQRGTIVKVKARGEISRRLRDMGLVTGTPVEIYGRAPLNDPVNLKLRGYNLTLRNSEADHIEVELED